MLGFKKYVIDTNAFTGIIGTEGKQRVAISHLIDSHDLSTILNNMKNYLAIFTLCILTLTTSSCIKKINATEKGFSYDNLGDNKGHIKTIPEFGYTFYNPFKTKVIAISTQLQHYVWTSDKNEGNDKDESIQIACKGGSNMQCNVGFNYRVNPDSVAHVYFLFNQNMDNR